MTFVTPWGRTRARTRRRVDVRLGGVTLSRPGAGHGVGGAMSAGRYDFVTSWGRTRRRGDVRLGGMT